MLRVGEARGRWVLLATILGSSMALLDGTVVNLALPRIADDLDASFGGLQWILNGYTLALAALILLGGGLGDRFGRRRIFVMGAIGFTVASLLCAISMNVPMLVGARVLQGVAAALLTPGSLAIIQASFAPEDRGRAIGLWSGLGGVGTAIGPFLGGWLVDAASWRWIFLLNVPLGIAVVTVAVRHVPETRDPNATGRMDLPGAVLGALALAGLTLGLSETSWLLAIAGAALLVAFVVVERRTTQPLVPMSLFRRRVFSGTNVVTLLLYGALGVVFFLLGLVLQGPLGYTPLQAGVATVPITLAMLFLSSRAGALAERIGPRIPMTVGPLLVAAAMLLLTRIEPDSSYVTDVLPGIVVFGLGLALTVAPLTATALGAVDDEHAGIASGVNNAVARTGQLLAVAAVPGRSPASRRARWSPPTTSSTGSTPSCGWPRRLRSSPPSSPGSRSGAPPRRSSRRRRGTARPVGPPPAVERVCGRRADRGVGNLPADDDGRIVGVPSVVGDQGADPARPLRRRRRRGLRLPACPLPQPHRRRGRHVGGVHGRRRQRHPRTRRRRHTAWLIGIARHKLVDHWRRGRARPAPAHRRRRGADRRPARTTRGTPSSTCSPLATRSSSSAPTTARP